MDLCQLHANAPLYVGLVVELECVVLCYCLDIGLNLLQPSWVGKEALRNSFRLLLFNADCNLFGDSRVIKVEIIRHSQLIVTEKIP